ncbi:MAG: permease prefix domain 1-containing protein [Verrucomicrobiales bacterium]|nr:permease prefix domain 1-containing protein [Verrucomicrobiales bacterium]
MFDLKEAIEIWREQAAAHVPSEALEELETHLQDAVESRIDEGMKAEEAFVLATHQLGNLQHVGKEISHELGEAPANAPNRRPWLAIAIPAVICVTILFGVECFQAFWVDRYESQVTFEVHPKGAGSHVSIFDNKSIPSEKTVDMKTQLEVIQSRNTLYQVVDELRLDERWEMTRVDAVERLIDGLTVRQVGGATMAQVRYNGSDDAQLVANIANAVATAYQNRTMTLWRELRNNELDTLQKQLKHQADKVEEARLRMLDLAERYRIVPETVGLANEAVQETVAATRAAQLALAKGLDKPEEDSLRQQLRALKDVEESAKDDAMDVRRKIAEYDEAKNEYELQTQMLHTMQEAYAKGQVNLTKPLVPITIHEQAEVATSSRGANWSDLWLSVFAKGWPWIIGSGLIGWWICQQLRLRLRHAYQEAILPKSVTQTEDEISWA